MHPDISDAEASRLATETHRLELAELDITEFANREDYRDELLVAVEEEARRLAESRPRTVLGMEKVIELPVMVPNRVGDAPPPSLAECATSSHIARKRFRRRRLRRRDRYQRARDALRLGRTHISFPAGTIPLHKSRAVDHDDSPPDEAASGKAMTWSDDWQKCG
jgi:hypothetical protein